VTVAFNTESTGNVRVNVDDVAEIVEEPAPPMEKTMFSADARLAKHISNTTLGPIRRFT
jgi:hypothetical protein